VSLLFYFDCFFNLGLFYFCFPEVFLLRLWIFDDQHVVNYSACLLIEGEKLK
jgi:hypothetical protein